MEDQRDEPTTNDQEETRTAKGGSHSQGGEPPMKRLGDFDLLRELGRGGMGVVYEARQISLNRRVALKVLPPGLGLTPQAVQRFEREAQAAAKLHHTNIVPVHAIGEEENCHYYAMELIEGQPLSEVLQDLSGSGSNPLMDRTVTQLGGDEVTGSAPDVATSTPSITSLSDSSAGSRKWFDAVAKLVSEVAEALHYAHGRGVIHRDIKPANLMLSSDGRLCITDFGLARVAQEPGMTVSGSLMGTPAYMSPEQIAVGRVKLDHRTDVYSLGAVLYELLSHRRPFPGESREEILSGILTKDPRLPRRFNPRIPLDLETICLKAMEKDPDRRYATAGEFAEDLRQYLQHGLIKARRAGIARRTWKSIRRHPVAAVSVLATVLIVTAGGLAWRATKLHGQEEAEHAISDARFYLREGEYREGLNRIEEALNKAPESGEARFVKARILLSMYRFDEAADEAFQLLDKDPDDWRGHLILTRAAGDVPGISLEEHAAALEAHAPETAEAFVARASLVDAPSAAIELLNRALELDPSHYYALWNRAYQYRLLENSAAAMADAERMIAVRPKDAAGRRNVAIIYYYELNDHERGIAEMRKAVELDPHSAVNYKGLGLVLRDIGKRDEAIAAFTKGIEVDPTYVDSWFQRAVTYTSEQRYEDAVADGLHLIDVDPDDLRGYGALGQAYRGMQDTDALRSLVADLEARVETWVSKELRFDAHRALARGYGWLEDYEQALAHAERAIALKPESQYGYWDRIGIRKRIEGDRGIGEDCDLLAAMEPDKLYEELYLAMGLNSNCKRPQQAMEVYARIIERAPQWADAYYQRGKLYVDRSEYAKAIEDMDRAIELAPAWADLYRTRGNAHAQERRYEEALADIGRAIELEPENANAIYNRANVYFYLERFEEALADLDRCFALIGKGIWGRHLQWNALLRLDREGEALAIVDKEIEERPDMDIPLRHRVELLVLIGRIEEAMQAAERAVEHSPKNAMNYIYRAMVLLLRGEACDQAVADLATARELEPENPEVKWGVAVLHTELLHWRCPNRCDADLALELAKAAVQDVPGNAARQRTHGMALYRLGRFRDAREALLQSAELEVPQPEPFELFALAMTEWKLGKRPEARSYYDRGVKRMNETYPRYPGYLMYQEEAAEVLGIED